MVLCALLLLGFTLVEIADVVFRNLRRPWLKHHSGSPAQRRLAMTLR